LFFVYTFLLLLLKCILFYGFMLDPTHTSIPLYETLYHSAFRLQYYSAFILIFLSFALLMKKRLAIWYLVVFNVCLTGFLLMDLWYARGFNTLPTVHLLGQASNLNNLSGSILVLIRFIDCLFILDLLVIFYMSWRKKELLNTERTGFKTFVSALVASSLVLGYIPVSSAFFNQKDSKAIFKMFDPIITSYNLSPIGYHIMDAYYYIKDSRPLELSQAEKDEISAWFAKKQEHLPDNKYKGLFKGKNLIVIQVESLENFVLQRKFHEQEVTPTLNRLLENSLYFSNYLEQVNEGTTSDAEYMTNTSVYPLRHGSTFFRYPYNHYNSLPKLLGKRGYRTFSVHPDEGSYWNWAQAHKSIGFQHTYDATKFDRSEIFGMGISDGTLLRQTVPIMKETKQPFYSFIVTASSHSPYEIPEKYQELKFSDSFNRSSLGRYLQSIHYADKQIGLLLQQLEKENILKNSVIVIYGDHEGIHKYFGGDMKEYPVYHNGKRVPLIIYHPSLQAEEYKLTGGQIDLMPTLAYLMGVEEAEYQHTAMGRNLLKTNKSFAVLTSGKYVGETIQEPQQQMLQQGLVIADKIIKSNYFKEY